MKHAGTSLRLLVLLAAGALAACSSAPEQPLPVVAWSPRAVDPLLPGQSERGRWSPDELLASVARLEASGRPAAAVRLARRDPAGLLAALTQGEPGGRDKPVAAAAWERATGATPADGGWVAHLQDQLDDPEAYEAGTEARERLFAALRAGNLVAAQALCPLPDALGPPGGSVLVIEARALEGFVHRAAGRPDLAEPSLLAGIAAAGEGRPFEASRLLLMLAELQAESGTASSPPAWTRAVELAAGLDGLIDPLFWGRALAARPAAEEWPAQAIERAAFALAPDGGVEDEDPEALLGGFVGLQLLEARRPEQALLTLARAEGRARGALGRALLRLAQARAMAEVGRPSDALATLLRLAEDPDAAVARPALSLLGGLELKLARPERARAALEHALALQPDTEWAGRTEAEANLGLACLLMGDEEAGLQRLRAAEIRFDAERDVDALTRCLRNTLAFATEARLDDEIERVRARLDEVEAR